MANPETGVGRKHSKGLFKQYAEDYPDLEQIYDLDEFHTTFLECRDMTEYAPAMKLVGNWAEWLRLKRDWPSFNEMIADWKDELEVKLRSESLALLIEKMESAAAPTAASIAKFLVQCGWNKRGAGRPSHDEVKRQARDIAKKAAETQADEERIYEAVSE